MKLVLYDDYKPGLLKGDAVVDISDVTRAVAGKTGQDTIEGIINNFDSLRPALEGALAAGPSVPLSSIKLRAPVPRPGKIMCMSANYREGTSKEGLPIGIFITPSTAVLDPEGTAVLPEFEFTICHHEAELVAIIGKQGAKVPEERWNDYIFGYTCGVDVSARGEWAGYRSMAKSFDGFKPIGPCIVTKDEIPDANHLQVRLWVDGQLRQDYNTDDMSHRIPECVAHASKMMSIQPGDLLFLGTNHQGLGPLQDGETAEIEIERIGRIRFHISDPLKRSWPKGVDAAVGQRVRSMLESGTRSA